MICSARAGTEVAGLYYQNDIESMLFVQKKKQQFRKKNVVDVTKNFSTLIQQLQIVEIRAMYGAGRYELATTHKRFAVDSARWHSWPEKRRAPHIDAFQNFRPGVTDTFEKPKTAARNPSFRIKQNVLAPEIIPDCSETSFKRQARDDKKKTTKRICTFWRTFVFETALLTKQYPFKTFLSYICEKMYSVCTKMPREMQKKDNRRRSTNDYQIDWRKLVER